MSKRIKALAPALSGLMKESRILGAGGDPAVPKMSLGLHRFAGEQPSRPAVLLAWQWVRARRTPARFQTGGPAYDSDGGTGECFVERQLHPLALLAQWNPPGHAWQEQFCTLGGIEIGALPHVYHTLVDLNCVLGVKCHALINLGPISPESGFDQIWVANS